jgi:hypothetical protein
MESREADVAGARTGRLRGPRCYDFVLAVRPARRGPAHARPQELSMSPALAAFRVFVLVLATLGAALAPALPAQAESQADREAAFAARMTGAKLIGKFSVWTPQGEQMPAQDDSYDVSELTRGEGDTWVFHYTMSYGGGNKLTVPIPVTVLWAGDTPVLTMTNQAVEGLGVFSVRVVVYGDRYAGTWQAPTAGGHMWGRVEPAAPAAAAAGPNR